MATPKMTQLQIKTPNADIEQLFDAPTHPSLGLVRGYPLRVLCNISAADPIILTYEDYRDTVFPALFPLFQIFAPRYSKQLCSANLDGGFWAKIFEDHYGECMPMEIGSAPVDQSNAVEIVNAAQAAQFDFMVCPFELPKLTADRLWSCPPASLFRGDVSLKAKWHATVTVRGVVVTIDTVEFKWFCQTSHGNNGRVPLIHSFERKEISNNSTDIGRGFCCLCTDNRVPSGESGVTYELFEDGENYHGTAVGGEDLMSNYRLSNKDIVPETSVYTPLFFIPNDASVDELSFAERSLTVKLAGASSMELDVHFMEPASNMVRSNLKAALGISAAVQTRTPPETPKGAALGQLHRKIANNGPRMLLVQSGRTFVPPAGTAKTLPTIPAGTLGVGIANSMIPKGK